MNKYQKGQNNQLFTRDGNFTVGELIEGSFTLIGIAQLVKPGVAAPPRVPEPCHEFKNGEVDAVNENGEITRIKVNAIHIVAVNKMSEYYFEV